MSFKRYISVLAYVLLLSIPVSAQRNLELPSIRTGEIIVHHTGHTLSYNPSWMLPNWVAYELEAHEMEGDAVRAGSFSPDPMLEAYPRAEHWHYTRSGWVRGHLAPAGDLKYDQRAMSESFYTSNVCPMNMKFNNGIWKRLEEKVRNLAIKHGHVYIITGPLMGNNVNGKVGDSDILVPDKFYKAVLVPYKGSYLSIAFVMDNDENTQGKLRDFTLTVDDLEKILGIDLFTNLNRLEQDRIEKLLPLKELDLY